MDLILVDGPNLYNSVARLLATAAKERGFTDEDVRFYMQNIFDIDRLLVATLGVGKHKLGAVTFHSLKAVGSEKTRLSGPEVEAFWTRQGLNPGVSTFAVVIPGATSNTEKGVDTSITSYLFETAESWSSCCIFSDDADFVPPVLALRRRGKEVFAAASSWAEEPALARAAQSAFRLNASFIAADLTISTWLRPGGAIDRQKLDPDRLIYSHSVGPKFRLEGTARTGSHFLRPIDATHVDSFGSVLSLEVLSASDDVGGTLLAARIDETLAADEEWINVGVNPPASGSGSHIHVAAKLLVAEAYFRHLSVFESADWRYKSRAK